MATMANGRVSPESIESQSQNTEFAGFRAAMIYFRFI